MGFQQRPRRETEGQKDEWRCGKMSGDLARRNQSLYCTYHQEKGQTTKQCRNFKDWMEQLVRARHLMEYVVGQGRNTMG